MDDRFMDEESRQAIAFVCQTLAPFFLDDPEHDKAAVMPSFEAFAALDVVSAGSEWPFVEDAAARSALQLMKEGAASDRFEENVWEYRRLFVGPGKKPAPPWGSVYTDRECVVFGATCLDLRAWMRENGIERLSEEREPEDHVGLLLLLVAWVAERKPELTEDLLRLHLLPWSSHMLEQIESAANEPFYEGLASLTRLSLEGIQAEFDIDVVYPRFYR